MVILLEKRTNMVKKSGKTNNVDYMVTDIGTVCRRPDTSMPERLDSMIVKQDPLLEEEWVSQLLKRP